MKKCQRSIRRILAVTMAVLLLCNNTEWTVLRAFATGEETPSSENTEAVFFEIEPKTIITKLPEIETSAMSMAMFAFRGVRNVLLAEGNHAKWIERLDLSGAEYAVDFYDWLIENSDNDGINDALIDPTANSEGVVHADGKHYYLLKEITGEAPFTFEKGATNEEIKAVVDTKLDEVINGNYDGVSAYATAVYSAFDRDYPAVFWLSGASSTVTFAGGSYTCDAENGTGTVSYNQQIGFLLKDVDPEDAFDIRATDYLVKDTITAAIGNVNTQVNAILGGQKATIYDNIIYFNEWLTTHNCYNSDVENIGHDVRECISALSGRTDTAGPVCEGYARAFKVLCDKAGIPCVLVSGNADNGSGTPEAHMWNYVQIDGKWYAVDVTWNDPVVPDIEDAVSNYERTEYLLVGSSTSIDGTAFAESHVMTNIVTLNGAGFANEPQIEDTAYEVTASCTAPTAREGLVYNGTEQELVIAGEATGGTMQYSLEKNGTYSTTIPVALNAGSYDVWYKVVGEGNYADTEPVSIQVSVAKATPAITWNDETIACMGDENEITAPELTFVGDDNPSVNLEYSYRLPGNGDYTSGLPDECGTFEISVYISATDNYNEVVDSIILTINKTDANGDGRCDYCEPYDIPECVNEYYQIKNANHLYWFADYVNAGNNTVNAVLLNDIVVNPGEMAVNAQEEVLFDGVAPTYTWTPIGTSAKKYTGTFNGNGYTISGLYMNDPAEDNDKVALFGYVAEGGEVKDICVANSYFSGNQSVGTIVGYNSGSLKNCSNWNSMVVGSGNDIGGITGYNAGTITNCSNVATVKSSDRNVGGVVGYNGGTVSNSYNIGAVHGSGMNAGGIVGTNYNGSITDCYNTGSVQGDSSYVGAITSVNHEGEVTNCYYLEGCATDGNGVTQYGIGAGTKGSTTTDVADDTTSVTNEQFASGEVAYLLNGSTSVGELAWYQTIGTDTHPVLDITHKKVYYGYLHCYDTAKQYTNDSNASDTLPDHNITYTAEDETITASCGTDGCTKVFGTIVISATGKIYDGTAVIATIANNIDATDYSSQIVYKDSEGTAVAQAVSAGTYTANLTVGGATAKVEFTIGKATPTAEMFVFEPPANLTYTAQKKSAEITTNKEGMGEITVKYYKDDVEIEPINAGTYTVKIAVAEGRNYTAVTNLPINTFTINKAQATITVATTPIEVNLGDAAFNLNATENNTDDEAALTYASSNDAVVRVSSDGTVTVEGVGTATITVSLGASTNYEAATSKEINITVNWVILSEMEINKNYLYSRVNADRIDLAAMLTEDCGTVEYDSVTDEGQLFFASDSARPNVDSEGILTYTFEAGNVGETGIITVVAETQNYGTITIKVNITLIDLMAVSIRGDGEVEVYNNTLTYGEKVSVLTFIPVEFVDEDGNVVEGTLAWQEPDAVPTVETSEVDWVFTPEDDAFALLEGKVSIVVNKANSVVTAAPTPKSGLTYNGDVQQLINEGTATGGEMQYSLDATTWNTTIPTAKDAGTYTVYYKVAGDANHNDIEQKTIKVTIAQKDITGAAVDFNESFIYDGTAHEPVSIAVKLDDTSLTEADYTISGYANNINAGTASITIAGKGNYTGTVTKNFTISKATAPVVVTPTAASITYGQSLAHATLSDNAWSWVDETIIPVSINNFEAYIQVDDSNYDYTGVQGYDRDNHRIVRSVQVIVNKTDITITAKSYSIKTGDTMPAFEYEVTGLPNGEVLPVAVSVSCTATNSSTAGTYDITVSGPASTDLYVITYVPGTLEITRNAQTITAGDVTLTYGDADKKITATTDGDGTFTYTVAEGSRDVISVASDGTITALKAGEATVRITAAETAGYKAAEKTIKVTVDKATLTIVSAEAVDRKYDGTKNVEITSVTLRGILGSDVVTVKFPAGGTLTGTLNSADVGTYTEVQIQVMELAGTDAANYTLEPAQYLATDVTISKADAYTVPVITKEYTYDKGSEGAVTLDIAALLKSDRGNTTYDLEQEEVPFLSECTIEENGVLKYTVDNTGNIGDMATIMIKATSQNYEDVSVQVKLSLKDKEPEVTPTPAPTATPTPTPTVAPTQAPTATPAPTIAPTQAPTATPAPTAAPVQAPATTTAPSVSGQPYLVHENGTMGWEAIRSDIAETSEGNTIIVNMNGATSVPAEVLADIKGKDITMTYQLSNGVSWTVNGNRITDKNPKALDFGVVTSTEKQFVNRIPIEVLNKVTSGRNHVDISLAYDGDLGMSAILNVNLGSQNKGYFANLFYYDENRKVMQFIGADDIDANGMAHLVFTHASEYSIVIDKEIMSATSGTMSPATGDSQPVAMAVLFMILASMGIGITLITGRKEDEL